MARKRARCQVRQEGEIRWCGGDGYKARLEAVWKRLSDRFTTVVADTSMITLSPAYATHFHDICIDGKENAKMTGDRMKMLMLTLPFMVRDLIAPEVN